MFLFHDLSNDLMSDEDLNADKYYLTVMGKSIRKYEGNRNSSYQDEVMNE